MTAASPTARDARTPLSTIRRSLAPALAALLVGACAVPPPAPPVIGSAVISGRLAVNVDASPDAPARSANAAFELRGDAQAGRLELTSPLGSMLAQARWQPGRVALVTAQGERTFNDLDAMSRELLGEAIPVGALFDWLRGRPWSGAPSVAHAANEPAGFAQLGWNVDLSRFDEAVVAARRDAPPAVSVRAKLDRP